MRLSVSLSVIVLLIIFDQINWCESSDLFEHGAVFKKHLFRVLYKHKKYLKKKGLAVGAAALGAASTKKKKIPLPIPYPIPIVRQPIIHDPILGIKLLKYQKFAALTGHGFGGIGHGIGAIGGFG